MNGNRVFLVILKASITPLIGEIYRIVRLKPMSSAHPPKRKLNARGEIGEAMFELCSPHSRQQISKAEAA
jgi:hypothetical protein